MKDIRRRMPKVAMSAEDTAFFKRLGARIAALRKGLELTQTELGEKLGRTQQQIFSFEKGRSRVPASLLPRLSRILEVPVEELLGMKMRPRKPGKPSKLEHQLAQLAALPRSQQRVVSRMLDGVLQQAS